MQTLNSGGFGKPNLLEKVIRLAIPAGLIFLGMKFFNKLAPTIIGFFDNLTSIVGSFLAFAAIGIPTIFIVMYVLSNPDFVVMTYKNLCRKITSIFIKMDFLSYMDGYVITLKTKRKNLQESKKFLSGKKIELDRLVRDLITAVNTNMKMAVAAKENDDMQLSSHHSSLAGSDKQSVDLYRPILDRMEKNLVYLNKLDENWGYSIEKLEHEVSRKRKEYVTLKTMASALHQAEAFSRGDTEPARIYKESIAALEERVTQNIAAIEEFEKNSTMIMKSIDLEKTMNDNEGLKLLEEYENNGNSLFLPTEYKDVPVKVVSSKPLSSGKSQFGNLLN